MYKKRYILLFFTLAALWGGSFVAIKEVIFEIPPLQGAFFRVFIGFLTMSLITFIKKTPAIRGKQRYKSMFVGLFSIAFPFCLLFKGEQYISAGLAGILNGTVPIWTVLMAVLFVSQEKTNKSLKIVGALVGFSGILVISWPSLSGDHADQILGITLLLGMAICYAIGTNLSKNVISAGDPPLGISLNQHLCAAAVLFVITLSFDGLSFLNILDAPAKTLIALVYLGVFSTGLAFTIFFYLMQNWSATKISTVTFVIPVFSILFDFILYNNIPQINELVGAAIIFSSVFIIFRANRA